jgi:hypothetical protein
MAATPSVSMTLPRRRFLQLTSVAGLALLVHRSARAAPERPTGPAPAKDDDALLRDFVRPPTAAKPGCYWWWLDGLVHAPAITRDLEEFAAKGIGEVLLVNSANLRPTPGLTGAVTFLSPEWHGLFRHALREAHRLGIAVGVNLCGGWCMGGPWIPPQHAGRWFLQSRLTVTGPRRFSEALPLPGNRDGYDHVFNPPGFADYVDLPLEKLDYRDTAVVAFPDPEDAAVTKLATARAKVLPAKTNRKDASNFIRARDVMGPVNAVWSGEPGDRAVAPDQVVDLTSRLTPDGHLEWDVPAGRWTIVRTGHRMTGSRLMIPPPGADGLSVGWLSPEGVELQFEHLGRQLLADATAAGTKLKYFCDDSFEDGFPNWTERIVERFRHYRGYDPVPWLPVLAGYLVGSAELADRFLHDYRKTVADCMADGHYGRFAELCHEQGLLVQNEAAGPSRSGTMCMDGLKNLGRSDLPMGEFWLGLRHDQPGGLDPKLSYGVSRLEDGQNKVTKMTASAAHIYGRRTASAESFTSNRHWLDSPATLKPAADRAFCEGINRLVIHTSTLTRPEDGKPGHAYYAGTHFNPNVTWWNQSGPFLDYLARCQHLLQTGRFVADVLYYNGDWAPNLVPPKHVPPDLGPGFDYDVCNAEVLLTRLGVRDGRLVLPDGMNYRLLVLPDTTRMPVEVARKLRDLVQAGATVIGPKPRQAPGLKDYPQCDREVQAIADEMWGAGDGRAAAAAAFGRGRVFANRTAREVLTADGVAPDFRHEAGAGSLDWIHRESGGTDLYFVVNREHRAVRLACTFRAVGRRPELWDPVTGRARALPEFSTGPDGTTAALAFAPHQSWFVIFRETGRETVSLPTKAGPNFSEPTPEQEMAGPWTVRFDPAWGGPSEVVFPQLMDWTASPDDGVRHYSGTATYRKQFNLSQLPAAGHRLWLDLGTVLNVASVRLNGVDLGVIWTAPWRVDVSAVIRVGENQLEIDVTNLWPNRLLGDQGLPPEKRLTRTNIALPPEARLLPSGLLGPVGLLRSTL